MENTTLVAGIAGMCLPVEYLIRVSVVNDVLGADFIIALIN